ncbi:Six-hairpin glycosidase-like protein [Rhexocercosporidium sp. MPI-PUGE-AT-0058]|nr:Six-hairpin glycosidase-like protein [Rhexocercosporidium sp. MPI-PUGE-AT-0058]
MGWKQMLSVCAPVVTIGYLIQHRQYQSYHGQRDPTMLLNIVSYAVVVIATSVSATRYSEYILAPSHRSVTPLVLNAVRGAVTNPDALLTDVHNSRGVTFGANSPITLDFGISIGGMVDFRVNAVSGVDEYVGFSFTESSLWISPYECDTASTGAKVGDSPLWFKHNGTGSVTIRDLHVNFTASPEVEDLRNYPGYFNSDSQKLNRVWYADVYTNQLCSMDPAYGNTFGVPSTGWYYNATVAKGASVLVDAGKRHRLVWPGDIAISALSIFVSTNSLDGVRNSIDSLFVLQNADGRLPWAGSPFISVEFLLFSFTYHLYTLLDLYYYYLYTGDLAYLQGYWDQYTSALNWSLSTIDSSGLANANAIFYHTLGISLKLAGVVNDSSVIDTWTTAMGGIELAINELLRDPAENLFFDNDANKTESAIHPQDGKSWAIIAGVMDTERANAISTALAAHWVRPCRPSRRVSKSRRTIFQATQSVQ